jgi:hypothetical protein
MTDGDDAPLAGVIYVTGNADVDNIVRRTASRMARAASAVVPERSIWPSYRPAKLACPQARSYERSS